MLPDPGSWQAERPRNPVAVAVRGSVTCRLYLYSAAAPSVDLLVCVLGIIIIVVLQVQAVSSGRPRSTHTKAVIATMQADSSRSAHLDRSGTATVDESSSVMARQTAADARTNTVAIWRGTSCRYAVWSGAVAGVAGALLIPSVMAFSACVSILWSLVRAHLEDLHLATTGCYSPEHNDLVDVPDADDDGEYLDMASVLVLEVHEHPSDELPTKLDVLVERQEMQYG
eukprot:scpid79540/ scgid25764/ 